MSYIDTIPVNDATGEVRQMYERQQEAWGYVPNYAKSFCHRPAVMERWGKLLAELKQREEKLSAEQKDADTGKPKGLDASADELYRQASHPMSSDASPHRYPQGSWACA